MNSLMDRYVDRVLLYANKPAPESQAIRQELKDRLLHKVEDLMADGALREEAILEVLSQHGHPRPAGYRLRAPFPWIDIRKEGIARGVIAIGPRAIGIVAIGGWAIGIAAVAGLPLGFFSLGFISIGLFSAGCLTWGWHSAYVIADSALFLTFVWLMLVAFETPGKRDSKEADWLADTGRPAHESSQPAASEPLYEKHH